ncbi:HD-GYP domain-containing protein [Butyrivibrio sp. MC2013]|uniref:HD-GYP domain-containing protein n=1 Tax=Butyrivibrio sp. MC2013 TaxID=1280686 RepID=UPI0004106D5B|nr:HD-GYP domain-containing protein [Butyrivibrio sp. MC2013]
MKRVMTANLLPGMVLAENVYTYNNDQLILPKGSVLDDKSIAKLEFYSTINVLVEEPINNEIPAESGSLGDLSYSQRLRQTAQFKQFKADFENAAGGFEKNINNVVKNNAPIDVNQLTSPVFELIETTNGPSNVFDMMHSLRQYDDATYTHCINVALISNILGQWLRMPEKEIRTLTTAGLLHDIGKLVIPEKIITKPARLTQYEYTIVQTHPQEGYKILKDTDLDNHIKNACLMHHERCDGTGYPLHLKAPQIDPYAKIVAIADVYDAMTSARVYRGPLCPFVAISLFENEGLQKYDTGAIMTFLTNIVNTYLLNRVRLNNGIEGDIVFINRDHLSKPTIRAGEKYIDLTQTPDLYIEAIV